MPSNEAEKSAEPVLITTPMTVSFLSTPTAFNKSKTLPMATSSALPTTVNSEVGQVTTVSQESSQSNYIMESGTEKTGVEELESSGELEVGELEVRILYSFFFSYSETVPGNRTVDHAETQPYTERWNGRCYEPI